MKQHPVAPDVLRISLLEPDLINVYLAGDVLIDAGGRGAWKKILTALQGHSVSAHALTHAHFDHQGGSPRVCEALGIPLWCGAGDRTAAETGDQASLLPNPHGFLGRLMRPFSGPGHPVTRVLAEGDDVAGFRVVETPGHTPGHLAFWREKDGILILGDVLFNRNPLTLRSGLREPFGFATRNPAQNRESARKVAALQPRVVCFGHGAHLTDGESFRSFVAGLEATAPH